MYELQHACKCIHTHMHAPMHAYNHKQARANACTRTCMHEPEHARKNMHALHACTHDTHKHAHTRMHTQMYTQACTNPSTHANAHARTTRMHAYTFFCKNTHIHKHTCKQNWGNLLGWGEKGSSAYGLNFCDSDSVCLRACMGFGLFGKHSSPTFLVLVMGSELFKSYKMAPLLINY